MILFNFQQRIYELLKANTDINREVYDFIPEDDKMPFITIGEDRAVEWNTKTWKGKEITTTIHIWSDHRSILETKKLLGLIEETLAVDFEKGPFTYEFHRVGQLQVIRETVDLVHGVIELTYRSKKEV